MPIFTLGAYTYCSNQNFISLPTQWVKVCASTRHVKIQGKIFPAYSQPQFSVKPISFFIHFSWQSFPCCLWQPFHLDSVLASLCFTQWSMHCSDHVFTCVLLSIPAPACSWNIHFINHDNSSFFCMTATFWIFPATVEPLNCMLTTNPGLWARRCSQRLEVSTTAQKIMTVLRKFVVDILMVTKVLD